MATVARLACRRRSVLVGFVVSHGVSVAVVGSGYWGVNLVRSFADLGALRVVCDVDAARAASLAKKHGGEAVSSFSEVLRRSDVDAVVLATPAATHAVLARQAIEAGKDVFVEKPMALEIGDAKALGDLAARHERILMVGHLLRYHPAIVALKGLITRGELGRINYISSNRLNFGRIRQEEDILWSFAPHDISAVLYLLDEIPDVVVGHGGAFLNQRIADVTLSLLTFKSGAQAFLFVSWLHAFKEQKLTVVGEHGMAVFEDTRDQDKLVVYPHAVEWRDRQPVAMKGTPIAVPIDVAEPLRLECEHFLESVRNRTQPRTDAAEGLRVLRVLHGLSESLQQRGTSVKLGALSESQVDRTAIIEAKCEVGEGTKVWRFSSVLTGSTIGRDCSLGQNVVVGPNVTIGHRVEIENNVSVYEGVTLEDDVICGPSCVFTNVVNPRAHMVRRHEYRRTLVKRGATIGANATVVCGVTIGAYAFIGAGAVVNTDIPDYALMVGVPARRSGWMCACGAKLAFTHDRSTCSACTTRYITNPEGTCIQEVSQ